MAAEKGMPLVDIINPEEEQRINELIRLRTFPQKWTGEEITGDVPIDTIYTDGTIQPRMFS